MSRKILSASVSLTIASGLTVFFLSTTARTQEKPGSGAITPMTGEEFDKMFEQHKNWGRWGKDDRLGTLNLITEAKRKQAAALVKTGISVSIAHTMSTEKTDDNPNPLGLAMAPTFRGDTLTIAYHGTFVTHLDALCHRAYKDFMYNGVPASASNEKGCAIGVDQLKNGVVTRGILIDLPRLRGVPYLEPQTAVQVDEILAWEKKTGLKISAGDAIVVRTGRWARRKALGPWRMIGNAAGLHANVGPFFRQRDIALASGDTTIEAQVMGGLVTDRGPDVANQALHNFLISSLGMPIIDDMDPEALAETAARLNRWEFMFVLGPLPVPGGTGGPVNPIAIF